MNRGANVHRPWKEDRAASQFFRAGRAQVVLANLLIATTAIVGSFVLFGNGRATTNVVLGVLAMNALVVTHAVARQPDRHRGLWRSRVAAMFLFTSAGFVYNNALGPPAANIALVLLVLANACDGAITGFLTLPTLRIRQTRLGAVLAGSGYLAAIAMSPRTLTSWQSHTTPDATRIAIAVILGAATLAIVVGLAIVARVAIEWERTGDLLLGSSAGVYVASTLVVFLAYSDQSRGAVAWLPIVLANPLTMAGALHPSMPRLGRPIGAMFERSHPFVLPAALATLMVGNGAVQRWIAHDSTNGLSGLLLVLVATEAIALIAGAVAIFGLRRDRMLLHSLPHANLHRDVATSLMAGHFRPSYQPIVRSSDADLVGYEALARWVHPQHGVLDAHQFLPAVRLAGCESVLDTTMMRLVAADLPELLTRVGHDDALVTVNVGVELFERAGFASSSLADLTASGLSFDRLAIELIEVGAVQSWPTVLSNIREFQSHGVRIAIDDFGEGFANLGHLNRFNPDLVKLDMSLVHAAMESERGLQIALAAVDTARACGAIVVAEGVENSAWQEPLRKLGVGLLQGFAYADPHLPVHVDGDRNDETPVR